MELRGQFLRVGCLISPWDLTSWAVSLPSSRIFVRVPPLLTSTPAPSGPRWPAAEERPVVDYGPCARLESRGLVRSPALQGTSTRIQHEFPTEGGGWEGVLGDRGTSRMGPRGSRRVGVECDVPGQTKRGQRGPQHTWRPAARARQPRFKVERRL